MPGSWNITPAPVMATAGSLSNATYNGSPQTPSACVVTPISPNTYVGAAVSCANNPPTFGPNAGPNPGPGIVNPVPAYGTDSASNYAVTLVTGNWSIAKAPVTAMIMAVGKTYDTTTAAVASCALTSGVIPADINNVGCIASGAMFASANASPNPQTVTATVNLTGAADGNYVLSSVTPGMAIIAQATANITVTPYNVDYDGNPHTATGTATGVGNANLIADLNLSNTTQTSPGIYSADFWTFTDPAGNYAPVGATTITDIINPFTPTTSLNNARENHTATLLNNGLVLIAGGDVNNPYALIGAELYNPATGVFTPTGSLNTARSQHTATLLSNGTVLIAGGQDVNRQPLASVELYNPTTGAFTTLTSSLNTARRAATATLLSDGVTVLIVGGAGDLASAELYNAMSQTFTATGSLNSGALPSLGDAAEHRAGAHRVGLQQRLAY